MPTTNTSAGNNVGEFTLRFDVDITAAGPGTVAAQRGDGYVAARTGAGIYTITPVAGQLRSTGAALLPFTEVLDRKVQLTQATPTAFWATITGVVASTGVITVKLLQANASPAVTEIGADGTFSGSVTFRL